MVKIKYTTGYAGTGKSHKLIELSKTIPVNTSIVLAPTHKALERLRAHLPDNLESKTVHAILGWIPSINENAKHINHIDSTIKLDRELSEYSHIIIDEAGMLSEEMFFEITSKAEMYSGIEGEDKELQIDVEIHCFLDPYQLLPVNGQQIQTDPTTTTHLTKQFRSESPDVVTLYTKFVEYLVGTNSKDLSTPYSENVRPFDINKFKRGDRMLAYTNKAVGEWNQRIAKKLGITKYIGQEVQLGNMVDLVLCVRFVEPTLLDLVIWFETGKLKLQNSQINKNFIEQSLGELIKNKNIKFIEGMDSRIYPVILGIGKANIILKEAKRKAVENRRYFKDVYALGRAYVMDYTFVTTVHKSQGSEFNVIFIDKIDIQKSILNRYYETYARLMYVAISRAKRIIYI